MAANVAAAPLRVLRRLPLPPGIAFLARPSLLVRVGIASSSMPNVRIHPIAFDIKAPHSENLLDIEDVRASDLTCHAGGVSMNETDLRTNLSDPELDGDHERMSHIVLEGYTPPKGEYV